MPTVEEEAQARQTYGEAPGWQDRQREAPPEKPLPADAPDGSSPSDAPAESSPAPDTTAEPTVPPKFNMPPPERWEELRRQREQAEQRAQQAERMAELALQKLQTPTAPVAPQRDPWEGKVNHPDPATAQFWQEQRALMEFERQRAKQEALQELRPVIDAGRQELAALRTRDFRKENPEITPGSPEETAIVGYVQQGFDLETAKEKVLYPKLKAELEALKSKQALTPQKRAAAQTESSAGIPQTAGLPAVKGGWKEQAGEILDKGGGIQDVLSTVFGGARR